jgi:hypothetical protein
MANGFRIGVNGPGKRDENPNVRIGPGRLWDRPVRHSMRQIASHRPPARQATQRQSKPVRLPRGARSFQLGLTSASTVTLRPTFVHLLRSGTTIQGS